MSTPRPLAAHLFQPGDPVICRVSKHTAHPGPRAKDIRPEPKGDYYTYAVDKFWRVAEVRPDGKLLLVTRRGKEHLVDLEDPHLRRPSWWERVLYHRRFPSKSTT